MSNPPTIEDSLHELHRLSGANQTALYYFSYPGMDQLVLHSSYGEESGKVRYWRPQCSEPQTIQRIRSAERFLVILGEPMTGLAEDCVTLPMRSGGMVIGTVVLCYYESYDPDVFHHLEDYANRNSQVFFHGWIDFIVAEQSRPLSVLFQIAGTISSSLDLERVLLNVVEQATILFRVKMSSLHLIDWQKKQLEMITAYGCSLDYLDKPNLPLDGSFLGNVVKRNQVMQIEDIFGEPLYFHKDLARREGVCSLMAAPIAFKDQILGVLNIYSILPRRWQRSEMELLQTFANHAAIAIKNVRVHEQFLSMEEQLQDTAKRSTLGELAAGLAHEIRNPLAVINILIHSWKASPPDPSDFEDDVDVVAQKISDLNSLVTDLLNLSTSRPLDRSKHNLEELIDRVYRLLRHRINQQRAIFKKKIHVDSPWLSVDRERLEQAVLNLMLNALDVTPQGGLITIEVRNDGDRMAIDVSDSGNGIPEEQIPELFKMFRTTKEHGSGLGLPITRRIVEEHNGEIVISRNSQEGVTFTILLPRHVE